MTQLVSFPSSYYSFEFATDSCTAVFFNQYINPIALDHLGWKYYIFYCAWLGVELAVVWWFYIETRNTPLEEIAKHFDGDAAIVGGASATQKGFKLAAEMGLEDTLRGGMDDEKKMTVVATHEEPKV